MQQQLLIKTGSELYQDLFIMAERIFRNSSPSIIRFWISGVCNRFNSFKSLSQ